MSIRTRATRKQQNQELQELITSRSFTSSQIQLLSELISTTDATMKIKCALSYIDIILSKAHRTLQKKRGENKRKQVFLCPKPMWELCILPFLQVFFPSLPAFSTEIRLTEAAEIQQLFLISNLDSEIKMGERTLFEVSPPFVFTFKRNSITITWWRNSPSLDQQSQRE